jgi:hypothetical protein
MTPAEAEIVAQINDAIHRDLEMGSHNLTNMRSDQYAKDHPILVSVMSKLVWEAVEVLPDRFSF